MGFEKMWSVKVRRGEGVKGPNWYVKMIREEIKKELQATVIPEVEKAYRGTVKGWSEKPSFKAFARFTPDGNVSFGLSLGGSSKMKGRYRMIDRPDLAFVFKRFATKKDKVIAARERTLYSGRYARKTPIITGKKTKIRYYADGTSRKVTKMLKIPEYEPKNPPPFGVGGPGEYGRFDQYETKSVRLGEVRPRLHTRVIHWAVEGKKGAGSVVSTYGANPKKMSWPLFSKRAYQRIQQRYSRGTLKEVK